MYDAATAADLETAGRQLFQNGTPPVLAGCAGFAAFLPELLGLSDGSVVETPQLDPRLLVLCGSVNPITLRQMDTAEKAGFARLRLTPRQKLEPGYWASADGKAALAEIEQMLAANPRCIIETPALPTARCCWQRTGGGCPSGTATRALRRIPPCAATSAQSSPLCSKQAAHAICPFCRPSRRSDAPQKRASTTSTVCR